MAERMNRVLMIKEFLREKRRANFNTIYDNFSQYSAMTIRRDLNTLIRNNEIKKVSLGYEIYNLGDESTVINLEYKQKIGRKLNDLLTDGDAVYFSHGTTSMIAVSEITKNIRVYTNSLIVYQASKRNKHVVHTVLIGGSDPNNKNLFIGETTIKEIQLINFDYAIYSVYGIAKNGDLLNNHMGEAIVEEIAGIQSEKKVVIADQSKFHHNGDFVFSNLNKCDYLITNNKNVISFKKFADLKLL